MKNGNPNNESYNMKEGDHIIIVYPDTIVEGYILEIEYPHITYRTIDDRFDMVPENLVYNYTEERAKACGLL